MLLQARFNQVNDQISSYLDQIAALQAEVTRLQAHAQEIQSVEQAAESALSQIDVAISMFQAVCPEDLETFFAAIDAKRKSVPQLQAACDDANNNVKSHVPSAPNQSETIEAIAVVVEEFDTQESSEPEDELGTIEPEQIEETKTPAHLEQTIEPDNSDRSNGNGHNGSNGYHLLAYDELKKIDRPALLKLASAHALGNCKSKKRDELASLLDGKVTSEEVASAHNGKH